MKITQNRGEGKYILLRIEVTKCRSTGVVVHDQNSASIELYEL